MSPSSHTTCTKVNFLKVQKRRSITNTQNGENEKYTTCKVDTKCTMSQYINANNKLSLKSVQNDNDACKTTITSL